MYNSPEYQAMINVAKTYQEGYQKPDLNKMQDQAAMKPDTARGEKQARKIDRVRDAMSTDQPGFKGAMAAANQSVSLNNKKRGLEKNVEKSSPGYQGGDISNLQKKAAELSLKAKPKRPRTRMKSPNRPSTVKKK